MTETIHESVLLTEAVTALQVEPQHVVVDATVGGAGHFALLASKLDASGTLIGIDADEEALARAKEKSTGMTANIVLVNDNFRNLEAILDAHGIESIDSVLFDLGWSSFQLMRGRGFSFRADEPLLMTYGDPTVGATAMDMVNTLDEEQLANLLFTLGDERFSRGIAKSISIARRHSLIETTFALVQAIEGGVPAWYTKQRIHPATKTFQALRIAVNDEFGALRDGLASALLRLRSGGRTAVITFHSTEDRIVKTMFREAQVGGKGVVVTKKPLVPTRAEIMGCLLYTSPSPRD